MADGSSQDRTLSIIKDVLSKTGIECKYFSENTPLSLRRQLVVDNASGKYILWLDADVILSNDYIKQQLYFMENHPKVAISVGRLGLIPNNNWISLLESIGYVVESLSFVGKPTSKLIGTRGSIFRVEAIKKIGGFDSRIKGAHEDTDVAYRLVLVGWKLAETKALLYEQQKETWNAIWKRHNWYGYGLHYIQHKHKNFKLLTTSTNERIIFSSKAYELTHRKAVFLLPLNFIFRKIALLFGFFKAHRDGYGHHF